MCVLQKNYKVIPNSVGEGKGMSSSKSKGKADNLFLTTVLFSQICGV